MVGIRSTDGTGITGVAERSDGNGRLPLTGRGVVLRQADFPESEVGVVVLVVNQQGLQPDDGVEGQVGVARYVRAVGCDGAGRAINVGDAEVVLDDGAFLLRGDGGGIDAAGRLDHGQGGPGIARMGPVVQITAAEILAERKQDQNIRIDVNRIDGGGVPLGLVADVHIAEQGNAMDAEPFKDGGAIWCAIGQVGVVVIGLQGIEQHFDIRLTLIAIECRGLQAGIGLHEQGPCQVPVASEEQVGVIPGTTDDLSVRMDLTHEVLWVDFGVDIVAPDVELGLIAVASRTEDWIVGKADGPQVGIAFTHGTIDEIAANALVVQVIDTVSVFMEHHV